MPPFNNEKFSEGEAAFLRGVSLGTIFRQFDATTADPNEGKDSTFPEHAERWHAEQAARESAGRGLIFGYVNGIVQAIHRIDQQMMLPQNPGGPTESQ